MGGDPVNALIDTMDDLEDFQTVVGSTLHSSLSKNVLITQRQFACQRRAISLKYRHNLFEGGSYRRRGEADHEQPVPTLSLILLPLSLLRARPGTALRLLSAF